MTGIDVNAKSSEDIRQAASNALKGLGLQFYMECTGPCKRIRSMQNTNGSCSFCGRGTDYSNQVFCPFEDVEEVLEFDPLQVYGTINHSDQVDEFNAEYKK